MRAGFKDNTLAFLLLNDILVFALGVNWLERERERGELGCLGLVCVSVSVTHGTGGSRSGFSLFLLAASPTRLSSSFSFATAFLFCNIDSNSL